MTTPLCVVVLPPLATAKTVPNGVHLLQARLIETTTTPRQFLFDAPEAVLELGNGLT
jgi:hypothetical protein